MRTIALLIGAVVLIALIVVGVNALLSQRPAPTAAPTIAPVSTPAVIQPTAAPAQNCDPLAVTSFSTTEVLYVNGISHLPVARDVCPYPLFEDKTGVGNGNNYDLSIPAGWKFWISAVSCQVVENGKSPVDYTNGPFIVITGPWFGKAGCYEAGLYAAPTEWADLLIPQVLEVHRLQTYKPQDQPIYLP